MLVIRSVRRAARSRAYQIVRARDAAPLGTLASAALGLRAAGLHPPHCGAWPRGPCRGFQAAGSPGWRLPAEASQQALLLFGPAWGGPAKRNPAFVILSFSHLSKY